MSQQPRTLNTRWSMLDALHGRSAEDTWRWFIDRYRGYIRSCLGRLIRSRGQADQAMEEIWSYLFTSAMVENADRNRRFRTYLAGIVRNFALTWMRTHRATVTETPVDALAGGVDASRHFEAQEMRMWTRQLVQLALGELARRSADQALALRLFYGLPDAIDADGDEPRSAAWIAGHLGLEVNAVHQLVHRARNRMRGCIERELRETVRDQEALADERRLVFAAIEAESPGLGGE